MYQTMRTMRIQMCEGVAESGEEACLAGNLYRYYFKAAIFFVLSAGASWGAWILLRIGMGGSYTGTVSLAHINSHGHVMIFGWVILFMMGFGYRVLPGMWRVDLYKPGLGMRCLGLMVVGILGRMLGIGFDLGGAGLGVMVLASVAEVCGISIFIYQLYQTFDRSDRRVSPWVGFVGMGFFWMWVQGVYGAWHFYQLKTLEGDALLSAVATYQAPLRDMQVHGMALCFILGVGLRFFPGMFDVKGVNRKRGWGIWGLINGSVFLEVVLFLVYRTTGSHFYAGLLMLPWLGLFGGCVLYVWGRDFWSRGESESGHVRYIRMGFAWLILSMVMLLLLPVYQVVSHIKFSHAYYGAIRHAITVGFITQVILGVCIQLIGKINGLWGAGHVSDRWMWYPFVLLNVGCFLRVVLQVATDWHALGFTWVGVSGIFEVSGITIWAVMMFSWMKRGRALGVC